MFLVELSYFPHKSCTVSFMFFKSAAFSEEKLV